MRLNKFLAECGVSSRRKAEEFVLQGRVDINGKTVKDLGVEVEPDSDKVFLDGERLRIPEKVYYLLNKPKKFVTTVSDDKGRPTVVELIRESKKIFPVGRLDYDTTGVLILTNDGDFANLLMHPKHKVPRIYKTVIDRALEEEDRLKMLKGLFIDGKKGKFIDITFPKENNKRIADVTAEEGRNRFVKNMFGALRYNVLDLHRISYAGITLDNLPIGAYRKLTKEEVSGIVKYYA
ncbi:MAG TPA: pseudouridine synthase [Ignavibacteriales bacterium]|nr:pseudouridine synthase [Ignavibacteriales bacterium]